jgi:MFS family permease
MAWFRWLFISAVLFGGTFLTLVTAVTSAPRRTLSPAHWTVAIAALTAAFAVGQCIGPLLAGVLADASGGVRVGLTIGAVLLALGGLTALLHDRPHDIGTPCTRETTCSR